MLIQLKTTLKDAGRPTIEAITPLNENRKGFVQVGSKADVCGTDCPPVYDNLSLELSALTLNALRASRAMTNFNRTGLFRGHLAPRNCVFDDEDPNGLPGSFRKWL